MKEEERQHYGVIYLEHQDLLASLEVTGEAQGAFDMRGDICRNLALLAYLLDGDCEKFRHYMGRSSGFVLSDLRRSEDGENVDPSLISILTYKGLLDALAAADFATANDLVGLLGGRHAIEKEHDHPFDLAFGYALKEMLLGDQGNAIEKFRRYTDSGEFRDFHGYAAFMKAVGDLDLKRANAALDAIAVGHVRQGEKGIFRGLLDRYLCVWGVGLMNAARSRGLEVSSTSPLLPMALWAPLGIRE